MRILVVDDDQAARHLVTSIARSAGHEVLTASDGAEALEVARTEPPELLVSDILMPRMDGYQLVREWKSDPALAPIPVVFLTASYTDSADERFAMDLGAERFLTKPVEPDVLLAVLAEVAESTGPRGAAMAQRQPRIGEGEILREYSDRLVRKLEQKVIELQQSNNMLNAAMDALSTELQVKTALIEELGGRIDADHEREVDDLRAHDELGDAIDGAQVLAVVVDARGVVTYFGRGAERLTGFAADEVVGRDWFEVLVPAGERDARRSAMATLLASGGTDRNESVLTTARGERLTIAWTDVCWRDDSGDIAGVLAIGVPQ